VIAHTATECGAVLDAIAGHDPLDQASNERAIGTCLADADLGLRGLRVGVVGERWLAGRVVEPSMASGLAAAVDVFAVCGSRLTPIEMRPLAEYNACKLALQRPEFLSAYEADLRDRPQEFSDKLRWRTQGYQNVTALDYVRARAQRHAFSVEMAEALGEHDVLLAPVALGPAPLATAALENRALNEPDVTIPFSVTGFPAIAVCIGYSPDGLPLAMQLVAKPFDERALMRAAIGYERATNWHARRPPV
jgi:aspartyl-tRNA(Asn)/glutamyl-tRNA(Gln) amidotransferase subunit A